MTTPRWVAITPADGRALEPWLRELLRVHPLTVLVREPAGVAPGLHDQIQRWGGDCVWHERTPGAPPNVPVHQTATGVAVPGIWSRSCHDDTELADAFAHGAAWCTLSPVFPPGSKPHDTRSPLGPKRFLSLARGRPVLALGGMTPQRAIDMLAAGVAGIAAIGMFFDHPSPAAAAHSWEALLRRSET